MDTWVPYSRNLDRNTLVFVGNDGDGTPMYVGRAYHSCDLIPGKLLTSADRCFVSHNGGEYSIDPSEVILNDNYTWVQCSDGHVPQNAIVGGRTQSGEVLYVGRANHQGIVTSGKVQPSHGCLYLPFGLKENRYTSYEVLVRQQNHCCPPVQPPPVCPPCNCRPPPGCSCNCRPPIVICPPPPVCPPPIQPPVVCPPPIQPPVVCPPPINPPGCPPRRFPCRPLFPRHKCGHKKC